MSWVGLSVLALLGQVNTATKTESGTIIEVVRLEDLLAQVSAQHPALAEARARVAVEAARIEGAEAWPEPQVVFEQWHLPLTRPWAYDHAMMVMVGLRQMLPPPGARALAARAVSAERARQEANHRRVRLELLGRAQKAYFAYYRAEYEFRTHQEHADITSKIVAMAQAEYRSGRGSQESVVRGALQLARRHQELAAVEGLRRSARALLNTMRGLAPDAPLGPPEPPEDLFLSRQQLEQRLLESPTLLAAAQSVERAQAELEGAKLAAHWPNVMVGLDYMFRPDAHDQRHGYGAMVQLDLPWLSGVKGADERAAQAAAQAERQALESRRWDARYTFFEAWSRYQAARETRQILREHLLPEAERAFEAARAAYAGAQSDGRRVLESLQTLLEVQLEYIRARAEVASVAVDVQLAAGVLL